jgi:hypothetical protein
LAVLWDFNGLAGENLTFDEFFALSNYCALADLLPGIGFVEQKHLSINPDFQKYISLIFLGELTRVAKNRQPPLSSARALSRPRYAGLRGATRLSS